MAQRCDGGRIVDLAVAEGPESRIGDRLGKLMYAASASGGVWKSINAGTTWEPVFDKQGSSSIGDIALAPSNPEILWVGTGEANNLRSVTGGSGSLGERSFSAPNPPFGTRLTYYLKDSLPKGRELTLAIYDSTGKRIRDLTVNTKPGMHRATWDLRLPAPYINTRAQGTSNQPTGAFVLPGRYIARLTLVGNDTLKTQLVETPVTVNPDPLGSLSPAVYRALWEMRVSSGAQQARVQAIVRTVEQVKEQMTEAKAALKAGTAPDSLMKQTTAIDKDVDDILVKVRGRQGPAPNDVDDKTFAPSIQSRVNRVPNEIGEATSLPTQIQRETLELAMKDLEREAARLNSLLTTRVPALNRGLDAAGVPWTVGRTVR